MAVPENAHTKAELHILANSGRYLHSQYFLMFGQADKTPASRGFLVRIIPSAALVAPEAEQVPQAVPAGCLN